VTRTRPIVAIDGPAGAGKSTVARRVADALGYTLVDTGAMYRAIALAAMKKGVEWSDGAGLGALAQSLLDANAVSFEANQTDPSKGVRVVLYGNDVSADIRTPELGLGASSVSAHPEVRAALLELQRRAGRAGGVVLEGRDIGTVVFPEAEVKFFLTATPEVRAKRRFDELVAKGQSVTFEDTLRDVKKRDEQDTGRKIAPLRQAEGAVVVDSSSMSFEQTVNAMLVHARSVAEKMA